MPFVAFPRFHDNQIMPGRQPVNLVYSIKLSTCLGDRLEICIKGEGPANQTQGKKIRGGRNHESTSIEFSRGENRLGMGLELNIEAYLFNWTSWLLIPEDSSLGFLSICVKYKAFS